MIADILDILKTCVIGLCIIYVPMLINAYIMYRKES
jgi:hypothetical protein